MLIKKVASFITTNNLISEGDHIIVALSGGRDSVTLLYILNHLTSGLNFKLSAIHVNHGIRGEDSDKDQSFVLDYCKQIAVECECYKLSGFSLDTSEQQLRFARYAVFEKYLSRDINSKIATAHHLNDQIETYLMRLFKGSGIGGMLGIPIARDRYIRPMLHISRKEIDLFCKEKKILYREDFTNSEGDKLRNKIRLNIIPQIERIFGKDYYDQFYKTHQDYKNLFNENRQHNYNIFKDKTVKNKDNSEILINDFLLLTPLQKVQYVEYCFSYIYGLDSKINREQIYEFETFVKKSRTGSLFRFNNRINFLKDRDKLIIYPEDQFTEKNKKLYLNKSIKINGNSLSLKRMNKNAVNFDESSLIEHICGDRIKLPLTVRFWQKGDYFYPLGISSRQKLSDFFVNNKIARNKKRLIPIVLNGDEVVWIAGYRIDDRYKIKKNCESIFRLELIYE